MIIIRLGTTGEILNVAAALAARSWIAQPTEIAIKRTTKKKGIRVKYGPCRLLCVCFMWIIVKIRPSHEPLFLLYLRAVHLAKDIASLICQDEPMDDPHSPKQNYCNKKM